MDDITGSIDRLWFGWWSPFYDNLLLVYHRLCTKCLEARLHEKMYTIGLSIRIHDILCMHSLRDHKEHAYITLIVGLQAQVGLHIFMHRGRPLSTSRYFGPILIPSLPLSHFVTHLWTPWSTSHISDPPIFSSTCMHTYVFTACYRGFVLVRRGFCSGNLVQGFCVWKVLSGVVFVMMHPLQQKVKHHFQI